MSPVIIMHLKEVMSASKKIPARSGEVPLVRVSSHNTKEEKKMAPVFSSSMNGSSRRVPRPPPVQHSSPAPSTDTFFSRIQKASDDREHLHCSRLSRVKQTLRGREAQGKNVQGKTDLCSILPLFSDVLAPSPQASGVHPAVGSANKICSGVLQKTAEKSGNIPNPSLVSASHLRTATGWSPNAHVSARAGRPVVQQYRNAVYHHTVGSTTNVVQISCDERTKEIHMMDDFVKSELLSAPINIPHHQPNRSQYSNSPINKSPNKRHRDCSKVTDDKTISFSSRQVHSGQEDIA